MHVRGRTNYPIGFSVDDYGDRFALKAEVPPSVGARRVCALMHRAVEELVDALEQTPERSLATLDVLPAAERQHVVETWNATDAPYPSDTCVHELMEQQVARTPDVVALVSEGEQLSYAA